MIRLRSLALFLVCALATALGQASSLHASPLYFYSSAPPEADSLLSQFLGVKAPEYCYCLFRPRVLEENRPFLDGSTEPGEVRGTPQQPVLKTSEPEWPTPYGFWGGMQYWGLVLCLPGLSHSSSQPWGPSRITGPETPLISNSCHLAPPLFPGGDVRPQPLSHARIIPLFIFRPPRLASRWKSMA